VKRAIVLSFVPLLAATIAHANALTEADVIRLAAQLSPTAAVASAAAEAAESARDAAGAYPNPSMSWDREHVPAADEADDTIAVTVPVDLSGRRAVATALAAADAEAAAASAAVAKSDAVRRALLRFYEVEAAKRAASIAAGSVVRLKEAARVLSSRKAEGTASGYDEARLQIEAQLAESAAHEALTAVASRRTELAAHLGIADEDFEVQASLTTKLPAQSPRERPSIARTKAAAAEASRAADAAGTAWVPTIELTAGVHLRTADEIEPGYAVGAAVELPLFSRGQAEAAKASAQARLLKARLQARERANEIELARIGQTYARTMAEAERFDAAIRGQGDRLLRAAESAYREGRTTIIELVDAHASHARIEGRRLALALAAKRAEIALRAARGHFE